MVAILTVASVLAIVGDTLAKYFGITGRPLVAAYALLVIVLANVVWIFWFMHRAFSS